MKNIYIINLIIISIIIIFIIYNLYLYYNKEKFTTGTLCQIDKLADEFCTGKKLVEIGTNWIEIPVSEKKYEDEVEITNQTAKNFFIEMLKFKDPPTNINEQSYDIFITQNNLIITEKSFIKVIKEGETVTRKYIPQSNYGYHWMKLGIDKKIYDDEEEITNVGFKDIFKMIIDSGQDPPKDINIQIYDYLVNLNNVYVGKKSFVIINKDDGSTHKYVPNDERSGVCWWVPLDNKKSCREICPAAAKEQIISRPIQIETNYKNTNMLLTERQRLMQANTEIANSLPEVIENTAIAQQELIDDTVLHLSLENEINNNITPLIWKNKLVSDIVDTDIELSLIGLNEKIIEKGGLTLQADEYIILTDVEWETILWNNYDIVTPQKMWKKIGTTPPNTDASNLVTGISSITYERFVVDGEDPLNVIIDDQSELYGFPIINKNSYVMNQNNTYYVPFVIYRPKYNNYVKIQNKYFVPTLWGNCSNAQKDILVDNIKLGLESNNYIDRSSLEAGKLVYKNKDIDSLCQTNNYGRLGSLDNEYSTFSTINQQLNIGNAPNKEDISDSLKSFRNTKVVSNNNDNLVTMDQNYPVEMKSSIVNPNNRNYYNKTEYNTILTNWDTEKTEILEDEDTKVSQTQSANCAYTNAQVTNWSTKNLITPNDDVTLTENVGSWGRIGSDKENTAQHNLYTLNSHIISQNTQKNQIEENCFIKRSTMNNWNTVPTNLNWKNIGRFQPSNKIEYTDTNLQNLVDILKQKTIMTQIEFDSLGLTNTINQNHYVIVDNDYYVPIVDPITLNNINSGEGTTTWVYNDTTNPDYMLLNDYKTKYDNLNNFNCAYTNSFADQYTNTTITPSDITGLSDVTGTWGKIADASELSLATTNYLCSDGSRTCDIPNQLYVEKSQIEGLETSLQTKITDRDRDCGMTNSELQSLGNTFDKSGKSWGRITPVAHIDSENDGLAPYDTNTNINTQKANLNCYYSLGEVSTWNNVLSFDNIKYGKIGTNSDEYMLITDTDTKIGQDCKVTNSDWNSGLFIKETPYGENVFKNFENTNYGVIKDSQGILTNDYITNAQCNTESQEAVTALEQTHDLTADKDQYRNTLNTNLQTTVNQLKTNSEQLKLDIETARSQHTECLNNLKDGNSFKISYDDYIKSKTHLDKLSEYKQYGIQQGNLRGQAWNNKYSKTSSFVSTDNPALAKDCNQQSISKPVVWHNVNILADTSGLNNITQDGAIGQWFASNISQNPNKTSFTESEINTAGFSYDQLNINDFMIIDSKYYKLKLEFNNPLSHPLDTCVDINKSCKSDDHIVTPQEYSQALQLRKNQLNTDRTSCISSTSPIGDIKFRGYVDYMNQHANKYSNGSECKRFDSVDSSYTDLNTCSNDSNGLERLCKVDNPDEVLIDCCEYADSTKKCLPITNKSVTFKNSNTNTAIPANTAATFRDLPKASILSIPGVSSAYANSYDETRSRLLSGKCEINSGDHCLTLDTVPTGLVWKKISKNPTHQDSNKMNPSNIFGLNGIIFRQSYPDIVNITIDDYDGIDQAEKTYIEQNINRWIQIPDQSNKVYIYDEKYNDIVDCKDSSYVDLSLYTTPKPGTTDNYCDGEATCIPEQELRGKIQCLNTNYQEEVAACSDVKDRCDFKALIVENCKTNSKSATGLSWYVITDPSVAPTDQSKRLNKNNKFTKLENKLRQIYINDDSQVFINIEYDESAPDFADHDIYLNKKQYQEYLLNELTEPLTSDHFIVIDYDSQEIFFKAIPAWSHSDEYDGNLSSDSEYLTYPAVNTCNNIGLLDQYECEPCPLGYYRSSYVKDATLLGHPEYNQNHENYQFSDKGYQIMIWQSLSIRTRIQNAISSTSDATEQIYNILDIIEDSTVSVDEEPPDPASTSSKGTKGLLTLSTFSTRADRSKLSSQYYPIGGRNMIMYISGYIYVDKEGDYNLKVEPTKFGYHIWINGIPQLYKTPTSVKEEGEAIISVLPHNFAHFEAILYNGNSSVGSGNYFEVSLTNEFDNGPTPLILNLDGIYPWCGTCIKCEKCTIPGEVRENCGIDGGEEYYEGICSSCGSCDASGVLVQSSA